MGYHVIDEDPDPDSVRFLTFVAFLPDGACAAMPDGRGGAVLPFGAVQDGEQWLLEASLRIPLETAGYRMQRVHPFAVDGDHRYAWLDGDAHREINYRPAGGRRFTFVHTLLDVVPASRRGDLIDHALTMLVAPGGRLLVSHYQHGGDLTAAEHLRAIGFAVTGESRGRIATRTDTTAWLDRPGGGDGAA